jgi:hypothetical protein
MTYKVIQWATGGVGRAAVEAIVNHPELSLVGCWVHSSDKAGVDVGELCGIGALGISATNNIDELLAMDADIVMYSPIMADKKLVARLLASGKNVVTPLGYFFPGERDVALLEQACQQGNSTLHGTGIHPGGITERFPLMVSALSSAITHVRAEEFSDIRTYGAPEVVGEIMLFGSVATQPIDSPIGIIEPGCVAAQRFTWQGTVRGEVVITVRTNWFMGQDHLDPPWTFGPEGERFEVEVTGDPTSKVTFHGWHPESIAAGLVRNPGIVATANHGVSALPYVCRADAGIKTYLDLPLVAGRAAPHLHKEIL